MLQTMDQRQNLQQLVQTIQQQQPQLVTNWMDAMARRSWNLRALLRPSPRQPDQPSPQTSAMPGTTGIPLKPELLEQRCLHFLNTLAEAITARGALEMGAAEFREPVQALSFTAGWMAGKGLGIADAVALVNALADTLGPEPGALYQTMMVVVTEAFMAAVEQNAHVRYRDAMERSQLVCALNLRLPCLFLVGDPDRRALDEALGRVKMLAVMREAPVVLVDGSGLIHPDRALGQAMPLLAEYFGDDGCRPVLAGVPPGLRRELTAATPGISIHEELPGALGEAAAECGIDWPLE